MDKLKNLVIFLGLLAGLSFLKLSFDEFIPHLKKETINILDIDLEENTTDDQEEIKDYDEATSFFWVNHPPILNSKLNLPDIQTVRSNSFLSLPLIPPEFA